MSMMDTNTQKDVGSSKIQRGGDQSVPNDRVGSAFNVEGPSISLPKGGGAIRGIGEKFATNPVTGTGSLTVPIATSPGRSGFGPQLSLSYDSGSGNGPFGLGWNLSLPSITRKTDKGLPRYSDRDESDEFILSGAEDLVPILVKDQHNNWDREELPPRELDGETYTIQCYRPRIEGLFAIIERWSNQRDAADIKWRSISKDNITTWYGKNVESRIYNKDEPTHIFSWLICESYDDKGNAIVYEYIKEDSANIDTSTSHEKNRGNQSRETAKYLKRIKYGNTESRLIQSELAEQSWLFEVVFDYGEGHYTTLPPDAEDRQFVRADIVDQLDNDGKRQWQPRPDPFSSYRSGFEVRTYRLCHRVLMFHHFENELGVPDYLVRSTEFQYNTGPIASFITSAIQYGYKRQDDGRYLKKSLPPVEFTYTEANIQDELKIIDPVSQENLPQGLDGSLYQWADLDGEGAGGILTEQAGAWYYKRNLSPLTLDDEPQQKPSVQFGPLEAISPLPGFTNISSGQHQIMDLAGDGQVDVVSYAEPLQGFFERTEDGNWKSFKPFKSMPNISLRDPNLKFVDLTGDGHADILFTEDQAFSWYASLAEQGFAPAKRVLQVLDEEKGPRLVFADGTDSIYLSDMSGDGLTDLVRIRNGEVCYWPNLGYCRFGAKVTMDNAPRFDKSNQFDQKRIRLADIDGSGVTDILYLKHDRIDIYLNESGNRWADVNSLTHLPSFDNTSTVQVMDLMGNGTASLVWSSPLSANSTSPMRYVDLMGGQKPHLLTKVKNNLGAETRIHYAPSTKFYLQDKQQGKNWITRLHFPVHVVERVETYDYISRNRFVTRYAYHHGYFDGHEREFRGFAMVEQWDTEEFGSLSQSGDFPTGDNVNASSHIPPIHTKTWFHTGAYSKRQHVSNYFAGLLNEHDIGEYFREPGLDDEQARELLLPDTVLADDLSAEEEREACRALKGQMLRQEVYAIDGSDREQYPYTVTEQNFTIRRLQSKQGNPHAVFFTHSREVLNYHYERNPADPRISHALTLQVDDYGNVLKSISIGYGRRAGQSPFEGYDRDKQEQTLITYTENEVTNAIHDPVNDTGNYRAPLPCEVRTYELTGIEPENGATRFSFSELEFNNCEKILSLTDVPYETKVDYSTSRKRLIECIRTLYRRNELGGPLEKGELESLAIPYESYKLAFTSGLLTQVYQREEQPLFDDADNILVGTNGDQGGYVHLDSNQHWWVPSGRSYFYEDADINDPSLTAADELDAAQNNFFLPRKYTNPFLSGTRVRYDDYNLLPRETEDELGNTTTVGLRNLDGTYTEGNNYRVLQATQMMGPNRNVTKIAFDALGLVVATAVMGKPEDNPAQGDQLEDNFETDLTRQQITDFFTDPRGQAVHVRLANATNRIIYDTDRFFLSSKAFPNDKSQWQPTFAASIARETHVSDLNGGISQLQVSFSYSDGLGREIQKKIQAERGPVEGVGNDVSPRWVGSGWTVFNNKGKPVRQYEPFFSATHDFEFDKEQGVSPILFYDPVGRVVATIHPNHSYEKVLFDPWHQTTYDVNDTVNFDPQADDDIRPYLFNPDDTPRLPEDDYLPSWYQLRTDPVHSEEFEKQYPTATERIHQTEAANRTVAHADTPTTAHMDVLGRPFLSRAHNGWDGDGDAILFETRTKLDIEGNQREVTDAKGRVVTRYDYYMAGPEKKKEGEEQGTPNRIHQASMEAGERWILNDITGSSVRSWDSRGHRYRTEYDELRRPTAQYVSGEDTELPDSRLRNKTVRIEKIEYGESLAEDEAIRLNLLTRVYRQTDSAGVITNQALNPITTEPEAYDFKGNLLRSIRQLCVDYESIPDWSQSPDLQQERFTSSTRYDALNRPVQQIAPYDAAEAEAKKSVTQITYNDANLMEAVHVWLEQDSEPTNLLEHDTADHAVVQNINYDAKGQRLLIQYGNGTETRYDYDENTFRLISLYTRRGAEYNQDCGIEPSRYLPPEVPPPDVPCGVQNLRYIYDPAGNITHIHDLAQPRIFFDNQCIEASNDYLYDPIYRLIAASGRECRSDNLAPHPTTRSRENHSLPSSCENMHNYVELYEYDEVDNFISMAHHDGNNILSPGATIWRRDYDYQETSQLEADQQSNRLTSTTVHGITETYSSGGDGYDSHGNMLHMPHLNSMSWDYRDQLLNTSKQSVGNGGTSETTWYVYDSGGQRVRKVTIRQNGSKKDERIYLGGIEIYRKFNSTGDAVNLLRDSLHIMDDKQRVAMIETKRLDDTGVIDDHNNDLVGEAVIRYQINNHLGSACTELDAQARVISYEEYHPYGSTAYHARNSEVRAAVKRYRYSGKERDEENGFFYYGARYYVGWLGRWTIADPENILDNLNVYIYVRNRVSVSVDPDGRKTIVIVTEFSDPHAAVAIVRDDEVTIYDPNGLFPNTEVQGEKVVQEPRIFKQSEPGNWKPKKLPGVPSEPVNEFSTGRQEKYPGEYAEYKEKYDIQMKEWLKSFSEANSKLSLLESFIEYHTKNGGEVRLFEFNTTEQEEETILLNMQEGEGGAAGVFYCAQEVCNAIQGVGSFKDLDMSTLPESLASDLVELEGLRKITTVTEEGRTIEIPRIEKKEEPDYTVIFKDDLWMQSNRPGFAY